VGRRGPSPPRVVSSRLKWRRGRSSIPVVFIFFSLRGRAYPLRNRTFSRNVMPRWRGFGVLRREK